MRCTYTYFIAFSFLYFLSFFSYSQINHVIVIGVDGMGSFGIRKSKTPVMDSVMRKGSYTLKAKAVFPTLSSPNWVSMILGVAPKDHKIRSNKWERKAKKIDRVKFPTIFKLVRQTHPLSDIALFYDWEEFGKFIEPGIATISLHTTGVDTTTQVAMKYMSANKPYFIFIHLDNVDKAGHGYGYRHCNYTKAIEKADSLIGRIISTVHCSDMKNHSIIFITSDHGFKGKGHGGWRRKLRQIPWLVIGPGIREGNEIKERVKIYDTAATIAYIFTLKIPDCWRGEPIHEIFKGE